MITAKENELYREIELFHGDIKIGEAEVDLKNHMLAKLVIYEPYQNKGFGTEAVTILTERYGLDNLWVRSDNDRAIHVYEKCGFSVGKTTMFEMVKRGRQHEAHSNSRIDAIPLEWLNERHRRCCEESDTDLMDAITVLCNEYHVWQKEEET